MLRRLIALSRRTKSLLMLGADTLLLPLALWTAVCLRLDRWELPAGRSWWVYALPSLIAAPIFLKMGLYRAVVRYLEDHAILTIAAAVTLSVVMFVGISSYLQLPNLPRGALLIFWVIAVVYITLSRMLARGLLRRSMEHSDRKRVLIYGAGSSGRQLLSALRNGVEFAPVAFVDDKPKLHGLTIAGLRVYPSDELPKLVGTLAVGQVLLAMPSATRARRVEIVNRLEPCAVEVRAVPGMADLVDGKVTLADVREVEIDEVLGRDPVAPDPALLAANIAGKNVMVTGAGGSIGSELCRQILRQTPLCLVLYELSEFALYSIERELREMLTRHGKACDLVPVLGSVRDQSRVEKIMRTYAVQTVYHAAAYKHVPLVEYNMTEGVLNNTLGTRRTAKAAIAAGVETFVLISTDKAVRPTNVMGASKRMAELALQALAATPHHQTRFSMVRFGNVLGSSGSVVPLFKQQIAAGGPVTVTHPEIIRYFMTIPEAAQLVIQAGAMGVSGEVFVLDMGKPIRIVDLARRMIHLSGFTVRDKDNPDGEITIEFTGLRPGEKLYEELLIGDNVTGTDHARIMKAHESFLPAEQLLGYLDQLEQACHRNDCETLRSALLACVAGFRPDVDIRDHLHVPFALHE